MLAIYDSKIARNIPAMPVRISYDRNPSAFPTELVHDGGEWVIRQSVDREKDYVGDESFDVYLMRDDFFRVQTPEQALEFIRRTGPFFRLENEQFRPIKGRGEVSWSLFQAMQSSLRFPRKYRGAMLTTSEDEAEEAERLAAIKKAEETPWPREWSRAVSQFMKTETVAEGLLHDDLPPVWIYPEKNVKTGLRELRLDIMCLSSYEAILASMIVDEWAGVENGVCKKCGSMFEKTTKHDKVFCSQLCGKQFHKRAARREIADARKRTKVKAVPLTARNSQSPRKTPKSPKT